jgi:NAD(P)-dependent dehydrogenase (short-subunit alcohol dehydrogenase family)
MSNSRHAAGVAIVTGAAGGMGSHCARLLAEDGWDELLLCDLDESRLEAVAAPLRAKGAKVDLLAGEITDPAFTGRLIEKAGSRGIGAVIHTAGVSPHMADKEKLLRINLDATQAIVDAIKPHMAEGSAAVLFASMAAHFPLPAEIMEPFRKPLPPGGTEALLYLVPDSGIGYSQSKAGVMAMVKREAKAFGERKARIVSVSPGLIDTAMTAGERNPQTDAMIAGAALPRMGRPEELASVAVFLCSAKASFITGTDVLVDGGAVAGMGL